PSPPPTVVSACLRRWRSRFPAPPPSGATPRIRRQLVVERSSRNSEQLGGDLLVAVARRQRAQHDVALSLGEARPDGHAILEQQALTLPGPEGKETRGLLYVLIDAPVGRVPFFVTHLDWELHLSSARKKQVAFIAARIAELAPVAAVDRGEIFPPILCG